jgi:hypothetical protein
VATACGWLLLLLWRLLLLLLWHLLLLLLPALLIPGLGSGMQVGKLIRQRLAIQQLLLLLWCS